MLPSLALSSSSLDSFRKNVYRPRLCLLLLLVLLSPYNTSQLTSPSSATLAVSVSQPAQQGWSISVIDGLVVAAAAPASEVLSSTPSTASSKPDATAVASKSSVAYPSPAPSAQQKETTATPQGQPPPGSLFRFPKLSWGLIVDEHVLPALLPLHMLWIIRLAGMAVEDGAIKNSLLGAKSRFYSVTLPLIYLGFLFSLAILTGQPGTVAAIHSRCHIWRGQLGYESLEPQVPERKSKSIFQADGLLPLSLFVMLEAASTVVHLISILPKVDADLISSIVPMQIKLPSPSHLPPLVELLPLPRSVRAALSEPAMRSATQRYAGGRRRPMMPSISTAAPTATADGISAEPGARQPNNNNNNNNNNNDDDDVAITTGVAFQAARAETPSQAFPQQTYRRVGAPENEILRSTSVTHPIAPLTLPDRNDATQTPSTRRRRAPRLRGQSVLVSTKWLSEMATALFDKLIGALIYSVITLRLPTLSPTSLPPVLSLLSLRSELASLTQIWSRARSSVECLEFVRRRWGVHLLQGQDPYASVVRPRAAAEAGDYKWKSYDDVYCAICFEQTRTAAAQDGAQKNTDAVEKKKFEFCRLDCGHELHDVCLVSWLTAQAFCPTCHVVLSFSPRAAAAASRRSTSIVS
ncbi:uncharacterized protein UTRI_00006_B [Ustilago trichophora]|uniref:RING-type domain-containing protein n=1 Tax=Ustilago trichophora TaxID=86804 RepID=A0A5C3DNM5_9BASI|nr:uncharacterized protein UTRI_00006_B [Ustilago trichophora]